MSRFLYRLGRGAAHHRRIVLGSWILALVALAFLAGSFGGKPVDSFTIPGSETQQARDLLKQRFPSQAGASNRVVYSVTDGGVLDGARRAEIIQALTQVSHLPHVQEVSDFSDPTVDTTQVSKDGKVAFASIQYDRQPGDLGKAAADRLVATASLPPSTGVHASFGGDLTQFTQNSGPGDSSEAVGLGVAVLVLLVAFGSVVAMGLPIVTALIGLGSGLMVVTLLASVIDIATAAPTVATMIGLGVGIDYSLFIVTRHREHLHHGHTVEDAIGRACATSGQAVLFAGTTVVIAILGLQFVGIPLVATMGYAAAIVVAITVLGALTLLPALLGFAGRTIDKLRIPGVKVTKVDEHSLAGRWSHQVSDHPWRYLLISLGILLLLTIPFFSIRLGQADAGNDPRGSTTRTSYDLLAKGFGPGFNGPLVVAVDLGGVPARSALPTIAAAIGRDPDVAIAAPGQVSPRGDAGVIAVIPRSSPQSQQTQDLVHRLRRDVVPPVRAQTGVRSASVTGATAAFIDLSDKIQSRLPVFIGSVLLLSVLLLLFVFRSILVPIKAAFMNLLGIGAAYGVVVAVFQWGWGMQLFGLSETVPIISFLPMFMFAILFGLSMDYEVFLMSRVREEYLRSRDNRSSVAAGISTTARVITAAAIIMVSVFGSFAFGNNPTVQMSGVGLATAVLLDATLIRMVLVPSTMALLGDRNWWLPGWLDRRLPHLDIEGEDTLPPPELEHDGVDDPDPEPERELTGASV